VYYSRVEDLDGYGWDAWAALAERAPDDRRRFRKTVSRINASSEYADAKDSVTEKIRPVLGESGVSLPKTHVGRRNPKNRHAAVQRMPETRPATVHRTSGCQSLDMPQS